MRKLNYLPILLCIIFSTIAIKGKTQSVQISKFPQNNQLFARNTATNKAEEYTEGGVPKAFNFKAVRLRVYRDTVLVQNIVQNIDTNAATALFKIQYTIEAIRKNHTVELSGISKNNVVVKIREATNVVAGDVFIINGQSNAIGWIEGENAADRDEFMRTYLDNFGWREAYGTSTSKWGARLMKKIITDENIPVAVFNEAVGGQQIDYYLRSPINAYTDQSNYATLYKRLKLNNLDKKISAIFWWQGESDGWETKLDSFRNKTNTLFRQWREDYNNVPIVYFQVRFRACTHISPNIFEAQRLMKSDLQNVEVMSSSPALIGDGCHFAYKNGYDSLGNRLYRLIASKIYGKSSNFVRPPSIIAANILPTKQLELRFADMPSGTLRVSNVFWQDFKLEGSMTATITGGFVNQTRLYLQISGDTTGLLGLTYYPKLNTDIAQNQYVTNPLGVGILSFHNFKITKAAATDTVKNQKLRYTIRPNIVTGEINIDFPTLTAYPLQCDIVNMMGQVVRTEDITAGVYEHRFFVDNLPQGTYFMRIRANTKGIEVVQKFVKI